MKKSKKKVFLVLGLFAMLMLGGIIAMHRMVEEVRRLPVAMPDLSHMPDGNYAGEYAKGPVRVEVEVTVRQHKITDIVIVRHDNGLGGAAETITDDVIRKQSLEVDAVSGATVSSKCILKAIENALENADL